VTVIELLGDVAGSVGRPYTSCTQEGVICFEHFCLREPPFSVLKTELVLPVFGTANLEGREYFASKLGRNERTWS
jgi:hypothetical protein